jgi:prepilin-type N-terminal cleavage/methylation domain-containing protein
MKRQEGFTLIEVLVSFVILSGAIILSFESYSSGLRTLHQAQDAIDAQAVAQSVLTRVLADEQNVGDGEKGKAGQFEWQISMRAIRPDKPPALWPVFVPVVVNVKVHDRQGRNIPSAALSTVVLQKNTPP